MLWERKADLRSKVPGPQGPQGLPGVNAVANDTASAAYVDGPSETRTALLKNGLTGWLHVDGFGADPTGVADSTAAFQAAIAAAQPGDTIYLAGTGSAAGYRIAGDQIVITTPTLRMLAAGRDAYATSIRCTDVGSTMITVKAPGFVMEGVGLWGDADTAGPSAGTNGAGATITGLALMGDTDGNIDAAIRSCAFQYLALGVRLYGRNAEISENTLFSNCLAGVLHDGGDPIYHTGPNATENRGHVIRDCRFHNIGTTSATAAIEFTGLAKVQHLILDGNHVDSGGLGRHIVITGTAADAAKGVSIFNHKSTELSADGIVLTQCHYPIIDGLQMMGIGGSHGIVLTSCLYPVISGFVIRLMGKHGITGTGNDGVAIGPGKIIQVGQDAAFVGSALAFDSTNQNVRVSGVQGHLGDGWFFDGSPGGAASGMSDCSYASFTLGGINSSTIVHHGTRGLNRFVEGRLGKIEDIGYGQYDLTAGVAKTIATVATTGNNFGSFLLEIEVTGRDSSTGNAYVRALRIIRPENGAPVITIVGSDATAGMTLTIAASGAQGVTVAVQTTTATFVGARVRASAAGGSSATIVRTVQVTMAAQP